MYYLRRALELGPRETFHQFAFITKEWMNSKRYRLFDLYLRRRLTVKQLFQICNFDSPAQILSLKNRLKPKFFVQLNDAFYRDELPRQFPNETTEIVKEANAVLTGHLDILGSGMRDLAAVKRQPVEVIGADGKITSSENITGYLPWNVDFKSGIGWKSDVYYRDVKYGHLPGIDVKVPWELSRCHHLLRLGQAYRITGDERFTSEFIKQIDDWITANPCRFGVNWSCTMEVGIRVVNWIWAFHLFRISPQMDAAFLGRFLASLHAHVEFIRENLEYRETVIKGKRRRLNSNHYLANIVGLLYVALLFPELHLEKDRDFAIRELEIELHSETYADGVDYEHSVSYHRLVLEMFLSGFLLLRLNGYPLKAEVIERLKQMGEFVADYSRPDGKAPQIGDNDSGRLHPFTVRDPSDHRYLLDVMIHFFGFDNLGSVLPDAETAWWLGALPSVVNAVQPRPSVAYSNGFFIMKGSDSHLFVSAASVGMHGLGSHSHNDISGFDYWARGCHWLVDPGTGTYTPDPDIRNYFRSTAAHNVLRVDETEINPIEPTRLFQLTDQARIIVHNWSTGSQEDVLCLEHTGYANILGGGACKREFRLNKEMNTLTIRDTVEGSGEHTCEWFFHFHPDVRPEQTDEGYVLRRSSAALKMLRKGVNCESSIVPGWYSPFYGKWVPAEVLVFRKRAALPIEIEIVLEPLEIA